MATLNRIMILNILIKHETLTIHDLEKLVNPGITPAANHLQLLLDEISQSGHIHRFNGITPCTYTITSKGIREGKRLAQELQDSTNPKPSPVKKNQ